VNYTVIGYKPDSADTCLGCVMERYDSAHVLFLTTDELDFVEKWAELLFKNLIRKHGESAYEITVLVNGEDLHDLPDTPELSYYNLSNQADQQSIIMLRAHERHEELKAQARARERSAAEVASELRQLAALRAKYGKAE
jgi:hypothetical protein